MPPLVEPFATGDSLLHHADPRARLAAVLLFSIPVALLRSTWAAAAALGIAFLLLVLARLDLKKVFARLVLVNVFIGFLWLFLPFSTPGNTVFTLGPLEATREGVLLAWLITLKSNAVVSAFLALAATIPMQSMGRALQQFRVPEKLCHLLLFTHRYVHVIRSEYDKMSRAARLRGFKPGTNTHTYRTYAHLVGMLLVRSWDRAERVHKAMLCRGFTGRFYSLATFTMRRGDWLLLAAMFLATAGCLAVEFSL